MDDRFGEAGGIVLDADSFVGFVEFKLSNAVDLAKLRDCKCGSLGGRCAVPVKNIQLCHELMIAVGCGGYPAGDCGWWKPPS